MWRCCCRYQVDAFGSLTLPRLTDPSCLYKAEVRDVVYADTFLLDIDLGFEVIRRQSIRLARIDAPPRDTPQGAAGRRFVRKQLAVARTIVVNTRKYDIPSIVSKYIGETEKNLNASFELADANRSILFFDEADALFGKRRRTRYARDRYARVVSSHVLGT